MALQRNQKEDAEIDIADWLRKLPKAELHLHLEGTIVPETLVELSRRHDAEPLTLESARQLYKYADFLGFLMSFKAVTERLRGPEDYELITYNMVRELAAQGVVHAEVYISFGIIYYWKKTEVEPYVEAIERGRLRGEQEFGTTVLWIIDAVRHFGAEEAARVFRKAAELQPKYPSIVGIGIGGDEARGSADLFRELYAEARSGRPAPDRPCRRIGRAGEHLVGDQHRCRAGGSCAVRPARSRVDGRSGARSRFRWRSTSPAISGPAVARISTSIRCGSTSIPA